MASIGKTLDRLLAGEIDKQHAVTKLQLNRDREIRLAVVAARIDELKEIQLADDLSNATKDVLYGCYIEDRLNQLGAKDE